MSFNSMESRRHPPFTLVQMRIHMEIGETQLIDYLVLKNVMENYFLFYIPLTRQRSSHIQTCDHILNQVGQVGHKMIYVNANERKQRKQLYYQYREIDHENDDNIEYISLGGEQNEGEFEQRHPGTNYDSDCDDDEDDGNNNKKAFHADFSPINTKAGQRLSSVAFAAPGGLFREMHAAYDMQFTIRIDDHRKCINYDFYEYKPTCCNFKVGKMPTNRQVKTFEDIVNPPEPRSALYGYDNDEDGNETDDDDPFWDQSVKPRRGNSEFDEEQRKALHMQSMTGEFFNSRVMRFRVSLDTIVGARLQSAKLNGNEEGDDDIAAVLVLELNQPPSAGPVQYPFAARKVHSKYAGENKFVSVPDWTPNQIASKASRHYIYGALSELKQLVTHLAAISPEFANFFMKPTNSKNNKKGTTNNTLLPPASIQYSMAPAFSSEQQQKEKDNTGKSDVDTSAKKYKMSKTEVKTLFKKKGFRTGNLCLMRAVLCGHVEINDDTDKDTVLFTGTCFNCEDEVECTFGDVMKQPCYAGLDYEDGGQNGAVKCENEDCPGMYLTGLCEGNPHLDTGKFHNHCTECTDFGICIHDYRNAHCEDCGEHYFQGLSGFPCPSCGGGNGYSTKKSVLLSDLPPPPVSAWNGIVEGSAETMDSVFSDMDPFEREMMKAMVIGPGYAPILAHNLMAAGLGGGSDDDDDSDMDI